MGLCYGPQLLRRTTEEHVKSFPTNWKLVLGEKTRHLEMKLVPGFVKSTTTYAIDVVTVLA